MTGLDRLRTWMEAREAGAALAGIVFGISHLLQRRLYDEVQALMPGGVR